LQRPFLLFFPATATEDMEKGTSSFFKHSHALVESSEVGEGTRVWAFAHVMQGARIGRNCNICDHAFVESGALLGDSVTVKNGVSIWDGVTLEDNVFVGPNAAFTNDMNPRAEIKKTREQFLPTLVRRGASIGANATIICGVEIGTYAFIGAGSVVVNDIEPYSLVVGNPARPIGYMCECGERLGDALACRCGRKFHKAQNGLTRITATTA
jgi:acetyltransferase-like isoleucine patch superfamily enzyme